MDSIKHKVIKIAPVLVGEPDPGVIEMCEAVLERAKAGTLKCVVVAGLTNENTVLSAISNSVYSNTFTMLGLLTHLAQTLEKSIET